jgi:hypothetical protein
VRGSIRFCWSWTRTLAGRPWPAAWSAQQVELQALGNDFAQHGSAVIEKVRHERPHTYLSIIASLCPRELHVERSSPLGELSDDDLQFPGQQLSHPRQ